MRPIEDEVASFWKTRQEYYISTIFLLYVLSSFIPHSVYKRGGVSDFAVRAPAVIHRPPPSPHACAIPVR